MKESSNDECHQSPSDYLLFNNDFSLCDCIVQWQGKDFILFFSAFFLLLSLMFLQPATIIPRINKSSHQILLFLHCSPMHHFTSSSVLLLRVSTLLSASRDICHDDIFFRWHLLWEEQKYNFPKKWESSWECLFRLKREVCVRLDDVWKHILSGSSKSYLF